MQLSTPARILGGTIGLGAVLGALKGLELKAEVIGHVA